MPLDNLLGDAESALEAGQVWEAEAACRAALEDSPGSLSAMLLLGTVLANSARPDEAITTFEGVLNSNAQSLEALNWLSVLYRNKGRIEDSLKASLAAVSLHPTSDTAHFNLGVALLIRNEAAKAIKSFEQAILLNSSSSLYHHHFGVTAERLGNPGLAKRAYVTALSHDPRYLPALYALIELSHREHDWDEVERLSTRALEIDPRSVPTLLYRSQALTYLSRIEEARTAALEALSIDPKSPRAFGAIAGTYQVEGKFEEAVRIIKEGLEIDPNSGSLFAQLTETKKIAQEDAPIVERMATLAETSTLNPMQLCDLYFGLGSAFNDLGDYGRAMKNYDGAHAILRRVEPFSREEYSAARDQVISTYTADFFDRNRKVGDPSDVPIFIVGLIRSGTTLLEQILSRHPDVGAAGEQSYWLDKGQTALDAGLGVLIPSRMEKLTSEYLARLRYFAPAEAHITDKNPGNIVLAGLIHLAFPNARIVHMRRHPVDNCLSIYMMKRGRIAWANDKSDLVFAYNQYLRIVDHWRSLLPADRYMEVHYEDLINDREPILREVLAFCGLQWDERCLTHENNERFVLTPSLWQVRQPIYKTSIERWKRYEPWLGALSELLELPNK